MAEDTYPDVKVQAEGGQEFVIPGAAIEQSDTIKEMLQETDADSVIPLPSVKPEALSKVLEYMQYHVSSAKDGVSEDAIQAWEEKYVDMDLTLLFQTMTAANFMAVKKLLDLLCKTVADMIAERTPNEILDHFNIRKDATWEEEQELIAQHKWIDPEGLIAKDREKRLAEEAKSRP